MSSEKIFHKMYWTNLNYFTPSVEWKSFRPKVLEPLPRVLICFDESLKQLLFAIWIAVFGVHVKKWIDPFYSNWMIPCFFFDRSSRRSTSERKFQTNIACSPCVFLIMNSIVMIDLFVLSNKLDKFDFDILHLEKRSNNKTWHTSLDSVQIWIYWHLQSLGNLLYLRNG